MCQITEVQFLATRLALWSIKESCIIGMNMTTDPPVQYVFKVCCKVTHLEIFNLFEINIIVKRSTLTINLVLDVQ
jgi:hypothetical protein